MVINDELKFPQIPRTEPFAPERKIDAIDQAAAIERIGNFKKRWENNPERQTFYGSRKRLTAENRKTVQTLVRRVNEDLASQSILIHLLLVQDEEGFYIDVYDCTDQKVCKIINDFAISVEELPLLVRNLLQERGLLVDKTL